MKILIVDDKKENLYFLETLLNGIGYETISANNGAVAIDLAKKSDIQLIISDILMPVMDGFTFCRNCKKNENLKNIPFVFYTATYTEPKDKEFALSLGAVKYILKPQEPDVFIEIIEEVLNDVNSDKIKNIPNDGVSEDVVLREYNSVLVNKLEDKMRQAEQKEIELKEYVVKLEKTIEEREKAEKELGRSELKYKKLYDGMMDGFVITTIEGKILEFNNAFTSMLMYDDDDELKSKNINDLTPAKWHDEEKRIFENQVFGSGYSETYEKEMIKKDGSIFPVELRTYLIVNEKNEKEGMWAIIKDITERKKIELMTQKLNEELEQRVKERTSQLKILNQELEAFSYSVSHDLRTPLRIISGYSKILFEEYANELSDDAKTLLEGITKNTNNMSCLIDDLLEFSKLNRKEVALTEINFEKIFKEVFYEIPNSAIKDKVKINISKLPVVKGDKALLKQVAANFISNAVKFSSKVENPEINVSANIENGMAVFCIKDNGVGFDMNYSGKLFGVFQRLHKQNEYEGTGVGLAIVKRIINRHGGKVWAESELNNGSSFYFSLPLFK
ncbi:MAG: response regulator [Melioribacteraceae bacterium]|nr:response regulator [Melioribacteraceae bacterium]